MAEEQGYSVAEAARRLDISEPTMRREVEAGRFSLIPNARPMSVTRTAVDSAVADKLERMGHRCVAGGREREQAQQIDQLEQKVLELKGALADLTAAHAVTLDTYRRLSDGAVPNN